MNLNSFRLKTLTKTELDHIEWFTLLKAMQLGNGYTTEDIAAAAPKEATHYNKFTPARKKKSEWVAYLRKVYHPETGEHAGRY